MYKIINDILTETRTVQTTLSFHSRLAAAHARRVVAVCDDLARETDLEEIACCGERLAIFLRELTNQVSMIAETFGVMKEVAEADHAARRDDAGASDQ